MKTRITELFAIEFPIIQAGMVWCSGWRLASAVSNAGGLGLIGAGSMHPDTLREHIQKCKQATSKPFGVNIPLLYPQIDTLINIVIEEKVAIVFTSAGNPGLFTPVLKSHDITVVHVVSSVKFALKAEQAGVDAIVAEGFEAGGHNGKEETTTMVLIPMVSEAVKIPVIAAGGIAGGKAMVAALALGAEGVQIGTRFATSAESSAHQLFKEEIIRTSEGGTELMLKQITPVRLIKNELYTHLKEAELRGASVEELKEILGKGRAKKGMFDGELAEGELEIGQVAGQITKIQSSGEIIHEIMQDSNLILIKIKSL